MKAQHGGLVVYTEISKYPNVFLRSIGRTASTQSHSAGRIKFTIDIIGGRLHDDPWIQSAGQDCMSILGPSISWCYVANGGAADVNRQYFNQLGFLLDFVRFLLCCFAFCRFRVL
jgi:hypothetical protein